MPARWPDPVMRQTNSVYAQPSQSAMTMGATATFTTPLSVEPTTVAVPPIKAGS